MACAVFPKRQVSFARALSACCSTKVEMRSGRSLVPLKPTYNSSARSIARSMCLGSLQAAYRQYCDSKNITVSHESSSKQYQKQRFRLLHIETADNATCSSLSILQSLIKKKATTQSLHIRPPSPINLLLLITVILKPLLQIPTQPRIAPQTLHPPTSDLPLMIPVVKPNHTLSLLVAKQVSIRTVPPINYSARRPRKPCDESREAVAKSCGC